MNKLGVPFHPPFRRLEELEMLASYPSWFWVVGMFIHPMKGYRDDLSKDARLELLSSAQHGFAMFIQQPSIPDILPRSHTKAKSQYEIVRKEFVAVARDEEMNMLPKAETLRQAIYGFQVSLQDELDGILTYTVTPKGSLDTKSLVTLFSRRYPKATLELLDEFICGEIDQAGRCLAFELPTSCGFHILRAVETGMKGYIYAKKKVLPNLSQRNWGVYIRELEGISAGSDLMDILKILKAKRNPLMHPSDNLNVDEAISLLCIGQTAIDELTEEIRKLKLEIDFKAALGVLPTL